MGVIAGETLKFACGIVPQFYYLQECPAGVFLRENNNYYYRHAVIQLCIVKLSDKHDILETLI